MSKLFIKRIVSAGLKPSVLAALATIFLPMQSTQGDEAEGIRDIKECRAIEAGARRLLCYDTVIDGGVFSAAPLQVAQQADIESVEERPAAPAVRETAAEQPAETPDRVGVTIVRVQRASSGTHFFFTDSGEVWKQSGRGSWSLTVPFDAEIKKGALGSSFLVSEGGRSTRIKRVR